MSPVHQPASPGLLSPPLVSTQQTPWRLRFIETRLRGAVGARRLWVWGSALRLPLSLSRGGLYFILFAGRLGLLSGFNDLCHYL